jgi:hypothetical protein
VVPGQDAGGPQGLKQPDYGNLSVWRTNRTQAAAKVDAGICGGMDDFEIPALGCQADDPSCCTCNCTWLTWRHRPGKSRPASMRHACCTPACV